VLLVCEQVNVGTIVPGSSLSASGLRHCTGRQALKAGCAFGGKGGVALMVASLRVQVGATGHQPG